MSEEEVTIEFEEDEENEALQASSEEEEELIEEEEEDESLDANEDDSSSPKSDTDPDFENYGKRAQKRIRGLVSKTKQKDEELQALKAENDKLKQQGESAATQTQSLQAKNLDEYEERLKAQEGVVRSQWEQAYENGDKDNLWEAQQQLAEIAHQKIAVGAHKEALKLQQEAAKNNEENEDSAQDQAEQPKLHPRLVRWRKQNPWFGADRAMTAHAFHVIAPELAEEGYNPEDSDDEEFGQEAYYAEVDKRMREQFPDQLKTKGGNKMTSPRMAGTTRTRPKQKGGKRNVTLSRSEVDMAKKLGITLKQYAKEKARLEQSKA